MSSTGLKENITVSKFAESTRLVIADGTEETAGVFTRIVSGKSSTATISAFLGLRANR